jgi:hypothetical protein
VRRTGRSGSPATRTPLTVSGRIAATRSANSRSEVASERSPTLPMPNTSPGRGPSAGTIASADTRPSRSATTAETPPSGWSAFVCAASSAQPPRMSLASSAPFEVSSAIV